MRISSGCKSFMDRVTKHVVSIGILRVTGDGAGCERVVVAVVELKFGILVLLLVRVVERDALLSPLEEAMNGAAAESNALLVLEAPPMALLLLLIVAALAKSKYPEEEG